MVKDSAVDRKNYKHSGNQRGFWNDVIFKILNFFNLSLGNNSDEKFSGGRVIKMD